MAAIVAQEISELSCVLIPLEGTQLLLPNICIAEILPWRRVKLLSDGPDWCLGLLGWRGETIPVIRFENLNCAKESVRKTGRCMVVMNRARNAGGLPFYALASEGLPRMVQLTTEDLSNESTKLGPAEAVVVKVGTEAATIPNLEYLEGSIARLMG